LRARERDERKILKRGEGVKRDSRSLSESLSLSLKKKYFFFFVVVFFFQVL